MKKHKKYEAYPSLRLYDRLDCPYTLTSDLWDGPLWTGHQMVLSTADGYGDQGFFHELIHWLVASPEQRKYPDLKLGRQVNANILNHGTNVTPRDVPTDSNSVPSGERGRNWGWGEKPITIQRAHQQEVVACQALLFYSPLCKDNWNAAEADTEAYCDFGGNYDKWKLRPSLMKPLLACAGSEDGSAEAKIRKFYDDYQEEIEHHD